MRGSSKTHRTGRRRSPNRGLPRIRVRLLGALCSLEVAFTPSTIAVTSPLYSKNYREVRGGVYIGHPPLRPFKVRIANPNPITKGVQDFTVTDERHYVRYDKAPRYILLRSENVDGLDFQNRGTQSVGGYAYGYGNGRVVFTAIGHTLHELWQPEYFKIQKNTARWLPKMI